ncbi:transposon Tf2-1 polyprotein isoform X1 [Cucumis melo var. makuwa]|uniref:Transposon Tf2-1 polyprotein isoform X1 n=1 Tax=Cucumis melo var. makuwa TaxID=1194695 RepID=A0A5D3BYG0_CUCMM|nr:transposon Tf2-1 polyprotein isoform X1 [Cucumis melo var. makuwa]TYK03109.1 transposon Tf2-1 polyprotein isoform X1 [Cucumis melo var. makuwa]
MEKLVEERLEAVEQGMQRVSVIEENIALLSKNIIEMSSQIDNQYQQQQVILKYIKGIIRDDASGKKMEEGLTSQVAKVELELQATATETKEGGKTEERTHDRSKFKKVEMLVSNGMDPDSCLFRADRYFKIHNLTDSKKLTVAVISFDGPTLDWYRSQEEREAFKG